ncbi:hypothetical protein [Secundilactobacillus oryzae]|uniref:hypothetical protein n=1 Tax=Secundilactobacillus oryzae TaxID=1202668 RepID=UPI003F71E12B
MVDEDGRATTKIGHGESLRILGLPVDTTVVVHEELTDDQAPYYKPSWKVNDGEATRGQTTDEIKLDGQDEVTIVEYVNWFDPGNLLITKTDGGCD